MIPIWYPGKLSAPIISDMFGLLKMSRRRMVLLLAGTLLLVPVLFAITGFSSLSLTPATRGNAEKKRVTRSEPPLNAQIWTTTESRTALSCARSTTVKVFAAGSPDRGDAVLQPE